MAKTTKNEKIIFTINGNNQSKSSEKNNNRKVHKSEGFDVQDMLYQIERTRDRRNAVPDTSTVSTNANISCQKHSYHQLAERVRELEKEIVPDRHLYQISPAYSPYSALTPCSNISGNGFPNYSRPKNFPVNLLSPNSPVPTHKFGLSSKILERAHQIPERFWMDWQQKQMQNRIEELEYIKNNLTSPNDVDLSTRNRRKSLLSLHNAQRRIGLPRPTTLDRIASTSIDDETSSPTTDDNSSFSFDQRSIDDIDTPSSVRKFLSTLDRSRLIIFLPFAYKNRSTSTNNQCQSIAKPIDIKVNSVEIISPASSIEDVAQIDTEVNLTLLIRENQGQINPLLYSKAIMNRTIEFRSSSKNETSADKEMAFNNKEVDEKQSSISSTDSFASARSTSSISVAIVSIMADEHSQGHIDPKIIPKKKENIRIFVHRKRLSSGILHKSNPLQTNSMKHLTSIIEKNLNLNKKNSRNNKNIVVVNYKPVFVNSRQQKSTPPNNQGNNMAKSTSDNSKINHSLNQQTGSFDVPDVEDPLMFIEMMYQQLFTEDGQLRNGGDPAALANCVKQIVTRSRRNSTVNRDSISSNIHQHKRPSTTTSSLPRFTRDIFNEEEEEEEEEPNTLFQKNRTANTSRRSSKQSSMDHAEHHQQQLHAFLNSYYHHQKRKSTTQTTIHNRNSHFSVDDTDNEDLDTFSDLNSYRKTIRNSPPASIDEDITQTDSKLLSSSGYQSLKSPHRIISQIHLKTDHHYCPNCIHTPQITVIPPTTTSSSINLIQPIREMFMKYMNFILISKNILFVPLFIFLLRQRSMPINN